MAVAVAFEIVDWSVVVVVGDDDDRQRDHR